MDLEIGIGSLAIKVLGDFTMFLTMNIGEVSSSFLIWSFCNFCTCLASFYCYCTLGLGSRTLTLLAPVYGRYSVSEFFLVVIFLVSLRVLLGRCLCFWSSSSTAGPFLVLIVLFIMLVLFCCLIIGPVC